MKSRNFWESDESINRYTTKPELWDSEIRFIFKAVQNLNKKISDIKILDLGCGGGRTTIPLYKMGFEVTGLDISNNLISELKKKCPKIDAVVADARSLPFDNSSFDIVLFSHNSIDYLETEKERNIALEEIHRILKNSGYFIFSSHYFNLLPTNKLVLENIITNLIIYLRSPKKGTYIEKMNNGDLVKTFYSNPRENKVLLDKKDFKLIDYTSQVDTTKNKIKDFLKSITSWEIYYLFEKK